MQQVEKYLKFLLKAIQDQQLAQNLKNLSNKISKVFDNIIKYSGDVIKFESEAKESAKQMEDATLKASIARRNMVDVIFIVINRVAKELD